MADGDGAPLQGVLAFGDSITHGGGTIQRNVVQESWALWVARGLGLPFTGFAFDGARLEDVLRTQIPAAGEKTARPDVRYDLGLLYAGVNDVRRPDWDEVAFARDYRAALAAIAGRCQRTLVATLPRDLGRPRAAEAVERANAAIEDAAAACGSLVADLRDFGGREHVLADHIHPTAFGQIDIAGRALRVLAAHGLRVLAWPAEEIRPAEPTALGRLGGEARYTVRHLQVSTRAAAIRLLRRARA